MLPLLVQAATQQVRLKRFLMPALMSHGLNFSHGTYESHLELIKIIRVLSEKKNRPLTILQDLQGPKLRVGDLPKSGVYLKAGEIISMELDIDNHEIDFEDGKQKKIFLEIPDIIHCLNVGGRILLG